MDDLKSEIIAYSVARRIAILEIDNPPVNALSSRVRTGLWSMLARANADPNIDAIVLACTGNTFCVGADIREFGAATNAPSAPDLLARIENGRKPVVVAIHGRALGGGLELALSCHWRVALRSTQFGLPEINLGLIPGAGGTQRLPRLIGIEAAARMILTGKAIDSQFAVELGILDAVWDDELLERAAAFAESIAAIPVDERRSRSRSISLDVPDPSAVIAEIARQSDAGRRAPLARDACVMVLAAAHGNFEDGVKTERTQFLELLAGEESRALRALFLAERAAKRPGNAIAGAPSRKIENIAIIGSGTMGRGIAIACADASYAVQMIDIDRSQCERAAGAIEAHYTSLVSRGRLTAEKVRDALGRIRYSSTLVDAARADMVIEAAFEEMSIKQALFSQIDSIVRPGAVLATNTSTLDVDTIAKSTGRPGDVLGMHFFSPANVMRLLEVVRGRVTSGEALRTAIDVGERLGKLCIVVGVCDGFVGNRMSARRARQVELMLQQGALPEEIDEAAQHFGFPMGPCAATDLAGLDISWRVRKSKGVTAPIADALCERNRLGQKTKGGYFSYTSDSRVPIPDPEVESLIRSISSSLGIVRRRVPLEEILDRLILPMVNEGARILAEGIAERPGDIDLVWVNGFGWPARRGGPMFYADTLGLQTVCERLERLSADLGDDTLRPAPLLAKLAAEGSSFQSIQNARS